VTVPLPAAVAFDGNDALGELVVVALVVGATYVDEVDVVVAEVDVGDVELDPELEGVLVGTASEVRDETP